MKKDIDELFEIFQQYESSIHNRQYFEMAFERKAEPLRAIHGIRVPSCGEILQALKDKHSIREQKAAIIANICVLMPKDTSDQRPHPDVPQTPLPDGQSHW